LPKHQSPEKAAVHGSLTWSTGPNPQFDYQAAGTGSGAAYRSSKTALDALTVFYAHALARDGFKVNALRPGCGPRISTPEPPAPAATQLTQRPAQSGSHCCPTTAPLASFLLGRDGRAVVNAAAGSRLTPASGSGYQTRAIGPRTVGETRSTQ
jgi:NAD(P)-dependent dehydrogenase (short-subunit alcohol dehydrogenase family)